MNETPAASEPRDHTVELADERIRLRAFRREDAQSVYEAVVESQAELIPWLPWCHADYVIEETRQFLGMRAAAFERDQEYAFAIVDQQTERLLGATGINQLDLVNQRGNLGYWLRTSATGQGIATRATRLVARFGLHTLGLERIEIVADVRNRASQCVAERAGASAKASPAAGCASARRTSTRWSTRCWRRRWATGSHENGGIPKVPLYRRLVAKAQ